MSQLLFAKQLADNAEFANEEGLLTLLQIIDVGPDEVVNGTSFAPGALAALKVLVEHRPELFTDRVMTDLKQRAQSGPGNSKSAAEFVLSALQRQA
jgi:hypothetical protein